MCNQVVLLLHTSLELHDCIVFIYNVLMIILQTIIFNSGDNVIGWFGYI